MKNTYLYQSHVVTAFTKEEAISKILADKKVSPYSVALTDKDYENPIYQFGKIYSLIGENKKWRTNFVGKGDFIFAAKRTSGIRLSNSWENTFSLYCTIDINNGKFVCTATIDYRIEGCTEDKKITKKSYCKDVNSAASFFNKRYDKFCKMCDAADDLLSATEQFLK